jgi:hypothetical protein
LDELAREWALFGGQQVADNSFQVGQGLVVLGEQQVLLDGGQSATKLESELALDTFLATTTNLMLEMGSAES